MICFKDRTFCNSTCINQECHRLFTPELHRQSKEWAAGFGLDHAPVAWSDFSGGCGEYKEPTELEQGLIPIPDKYNEG